MSIVYSNRLVSIFILAIAGLSSIYAQSPSITTSVNANPVRLNSRVQISVTLDNCTSSSGNIPMPQIKGLTFLGGPSQQHSSNWVNGKKTSKHVYTYSYSISSTQDIKIPVINLTTSAGVLTSQPFIIRVLKDGAKMPNTKQQKGLGNLATVIEVSKRKVHLGEPIVFEYKIYNQHNSLEVREYNLPELKGFWKEEVETKEARWETEIINGKRYQVATVGRVVAFPQQTGSFNIDGFNIKGFVRVNFFNGSNVTATSKSIKIQVLPYPNGKPPGFIGTFSNLTVDAVVEVDSVGVNEAFNFTVKYSGTGNLKLLREPEILWPTEFEVFDPEMKDRINVSQYGQSGKRSYKYVIIPRAPGDYELPNFKVSYFDSKSDKFMRTTTNSGKIVVYVRESGDEGETMFGTKSDVMILNHDIRHINTTHAHWRSRDDGKLQKLCLYLLFFLGPIVAGMAYLFRLRRDSELHDPTGTKSKKALKVLHKVLGECSKLKSREEAFTILGEALEVYLCSKLQIGRSSFSRNTGVTALDKIVGKGDADKWDGLLKTCEMARFAPGLLPDIEDSISIARDLTKKGEKKIKSSNLLGLGIILLSMVMAPSLAIGNDKDVDELFQQANDAYVDGQYELAAELYEEVAQNHLCFELEYNMGNAHYKLNHIGESILHYERARLINPLNGDLRANLLLAELRAIDRIEALPGVGIDRLVSVIFAGNLYLVWLILSLVTWTTAFVFIAINLRWGVSLSKPFLRGGAVVSAALSLVFLLFLYATNKRISKSSSAIVMDSRVEVRSMPGELGMSLFQLHEGTKACIVSKENEWTQVKLDNGNVGWVLTSAIEPI